MFGSAILDVAIGMIFIYLLLSLICSAVNEIIEAALKNRSKDLERGIHSMLSDPALAAKFYNHALVRSLSRAGKGRKGKPSYIPSRTFSLALLDIVMPGASSNEVSSSSHSVQNVRDSISNFSLADATGGKQSQADAALVPVKEALLALLDAAQGDIKKFRANVEGWYDSVMDRVSGWYKRRVQVIILLLGFVVAIGINADSSYIARRLANDPALRNTLVAAAENYSKQPPATNGNSLDAKTEMEKGRTQFSDSLKEIKGLGLPIGWNIDSADGNLNWPGLRLNGPVLKAWYSLIRFHWLGWLMTGFAISIGAPFWFDMLNKFIVVRSTVKPQEKSGIEPSKA